MKDKISSVFGSKFLPIIILVFAIFVAFLLKLSGGDFTPIPPKEILPKVKVQVVEVQDINVPIHSQGLVTPKTEINLAPEVSGKVIEVTDKLAGGQFFKKGDILFKIDPVPYDLEITKASAAVAKAKLNLTHAKSRGAKALLDEAKSSLAAMRAGLKMAKRQKENTTVRAPFDGMVKSTKLGFGQVVSLGMPVAVIYATDAAEVRLPLTDVQIGLIDIPKEDTPLERLPEVTLSATYAGKIYSWNGKIVRFESSIDQRNRLQYVVAHVDDPFKKDKNDPNKPMLVSGLFVRAIIEGKNLKQIVSVPRGALRNQDTVLTVDKNYRLKIKKVNVVYRGREYVFIDSGLETGEKVITTPMDVVVDGMMVQVSVSK